MDSGVWTWHPHKINITSIQCKHAFHPIHTAGDASSVQFPFKIYKQCINIHKSDKGHVSTPSKDEPTNKSKKKELQPNVPMHSAEVGLFTISQPGNQLLCVWDRILSPAPKCSPVLSAASASQTVIKTAFLSTTRVLHFWAWDLQPEVIMRFTGWQEVKVQLLLL